MVLSNDMKKAIAFGLIIGAILSVCNMCFANETISLDTYISNAGLSFNDGGSIVSSSGRVYYLELEPGYIYNVNPSTDTQRIAFGNSLEIGSNVYDLTLLQSSFSFLASNYKYAYFFVGTGTSGFSGSIDREELPGLSGVVDNLAYDLSYSDLSGVLFFVVPIMSIGILFALGAFLAKKVVKAIDDSKGGV